MIISCLDARIGEVYWGAYRIAGGQVQALQDERLSVPAQVSIAWEHACDTWYGAGNGWQFRDVMQAELLAQVPAWNDEMLPRAGDMAVLAERIFSRSGGLPAEAAVPVYLRDKVTHGGK